MSPWTQASSYNNGEVTVKKIDDRTVASHMQFNCQWSTNKRERKRELNEIRAGTRNENVNAGLATAPVQAPQMEDPFATLQKLKTLLNISLITQAEFDTKKQEVLARM